MQKYTPRQLLIKCTKSNGGAFMKGEWYTAHMDEDTNWTVKGVDNEAYSLERSMWGRLVHISETQRFYFEPSED